MMMMMIDYLIGGGDGTGIRGRGGKALRVVHGVCYKDQNAITSIANYGRKWVLKKKKT